MERSIRGRRLALGLAAVIAICCGCSASNSIPTRIASAVPTAPPPQTPAAPSAGLAAQPTPFFSTPEPPSPEVVSVVDKVKIKITELPQGFTYGQFQFYQANAQATNG